MGVEAPKDDEPLVFIAFGAPRLLRHLFLYCLEHPGCWDIGFYNVWSTPVAGILVFIMFGAPLLLGYWFL